jgi:hypothetical protein
MFECWEISLGIVAPSSVHVFESPDWHCSSIGSIVAISLWTGQYPSLAHILRMDVPLENLFVS